MTLERKAQRFLPLTEASFCILVALATPRHGYAVMQCVEEASGGRIRLGPGTLYGGLTKLQGQKLVERVTGGDDNDDRRKLYVLTELGREVAHAESRRLVDMARLGRELLGIEGGSDER